MSSFFFRYGKARLVEAALDWADPDLDVRVALVDADAALVPDKGAASLDALLAPGDELSTTGYARQDVGGRSAGIGPAWVEWYADDVVFPGLGPAEDGPDVGGAIVYLAGDDDASSVPLLWLEDVVGPTNGGDWTISVPGALLSLQDPA